MWFYSREMSSGTRSKARTSNTLNRTQKLEFATHRNSKAPYNVLSVLQGAHSVGEGVTGFLSEEDKKALRLVSDATKKAVNIGEEFGFKDIPITGPLSVWRRRFPKAKFANISRRNDLEDIDFQYLEGIKEINMSDCDNSKIGRRAFRYLHDVEILNISNFFTNAENLGNIFVNLKKLRTLIAKNCSIIRNKTFEDNETPLFRDLRVLDISRCKQISNYPFKYFENLEELNISYCDQYITSNAFKHLKKIKILNMAYCNQVEINDEAFTHLENLHTLIMKGCRQNTISDNAFKNLRSLTTLDISHCNQLTSEAFHYFKNIKKLNMEELTQNTIRSDTFLKLENIEELNMSFCTSERADGHNTGITDNVFEFLRNPEKLKILDISYCNQFTDETFKTFNKFTNLRELSMEGCDQHTITDEAFKHFDKITALNMKYCEQNTISDNAFTNLKNLTILIMNRCKQTTITSEAFKNLMSIQNLIMMGCKQNTIGDKAFEYLGKIKTLKMLNISNCDQNTISDDAFKHLSSLTKLEMRYCNQEEITGESLTRDNLPKLKILDIYRTNKSTQKYAEYNFGVTGHDEHVKPQVGRTRYARTAKLSVKRYSTLTRRN